MRLRYAVFRPVGLYVVGHEFSHAVAAWLSGKKVKAWWFDPRHGTATEIGVFDKKGVREFKPPIHGKGNDWVLVLDDASKSFPLPGQDAR